MGSKYLIPAFKAPLKGPQYFTEAPRRNSDSMRDTPKREAAPASQPAGLSGPTQAPCQEGARALKGRTNSKGPYIHIYIYIYIEHMHI